MHWKSALKKLETDERNTVVTNAVVAAGDGDDDILPLMDPFVVGIRNFGKVSAYELAFKLYVFLEERGSLDLLIE